MCNFQLRCDGNIIADKIRPNKWLERRERVREREIGSEKDKEREKGCETSPFVSLSGSISVPLDWFAAGRSYVVLIAFKRF